MPYLKSTYWHATVCGSLHARLTAHSLGRGCIILTKPRPGAPCHRNNQRKLSSRHLCSTPSLPAVTSLNLTPKVDLEMESFPRAPADQIDWSNLGFTFREVNGHIESTYSRATGEWSPLRFVRDPYVKIHGMASGLNYGHQSAEGLKAFRMPGDSAVSVFRPESNARRMQHSATVASLPQVPADMFIQACRSAVALNSEFVPPHDTGAALYLRPQLYGSSPQLPLTVADECLFCVFAVPTSTYHGLQPIRALILDDFDRTAPNGAGHAKLGGNYAPVMRWTDKARREGFGITLHLDSATHQDIDEFSTAAFIGIVVDDREGHVKILVPQSKCIIESITSDSVVQIAESYGWETEKRAVRYEELPLCTEVVAVGTAASLVPIRSITRRRGGTLAGSRVQNDGESETITYMPLSREEAGPICRRLSAALKGIQQGKSADLFGWRVMVTSSDMDISGTGAV